MTFVHIGGVLLVFLYLIIPAACANFLARRLGVLLAIGCGVPTLGRVTGLYCSYTFDLPIEAAIVCVLGLVLLLVRMAASFRAASPKKGS